MTPAQASNTARVIAASTILLASDARSASQVAPGAAALCKQFLSGSRTERWLAWREEPFTWAIAPEALADFLAQRGFQLMEMALTQEFSRPAKIGASAALDGEHLVVCRPFTF